MVVVIGVGGADSSGAEHDLESGMELESQLGNRFRELFTLWALLSVMEVGSRMV